jgi:DNA-binding NtrC family response regulator
LQITHSMSSYYDESGNPSAGLEGVGLAELERRARSANGGLALPLKDWIALAEAWRIAQALRETRGNRSAAARVLGIGRRTLYSKMAKLGLEPAWGVSGRRADFVGRPLEVREERRG